MYYLQYNLRRILSHVSVPEWVDFVERRLRWEGGLNLLEIYKLAARVRRIGTVFFVTEIIVNLTFRT